MSLACERCGVGRRDVRGTCDWCAAPARARLPFWIVFRRRLLQSALAVNARRRGALATGMTVGMVLHLLVAAVGVAFGLPPLWQAGFLWSQQWWWALAPEAWQPWLFAAVCGMAYGALAGWVAGKGKRGRGGAATVTALVAFVVAGWEPEVGTEYQLVAAALGAAVGRLTTLMLRGGARPVDRERTDASPSGQGPR
jgi:hypothetical protein